MTEELYEIYKKHPSVQTDSRKIKTGDLFFALKGPNFNGNKFAQQALNDGAAYAVIDEKEYEIKGKTFLVDDVLTALQKLANYHRRKMDDRPGGKALRVLAITGSNGKTTTKELIHAVLSTTWKTYTTEGNLNNHIGVPLTLLKIKDDAVIAVVEMGANHIGEIKSYCEIAVPSHGIITNCGKAHLEGFGSEEGVRKGKGELFDHLRNLTHGYAFVMWDYDYLHDMSKGISGVIKYGTVPEAHIIGKVKSSAPFLTVEVTQGMELKEINTRLVGEYNLPNVLAAVTVGKFFEVPEQKILEAIENYNPSNSRSQLLKKGNNTFIMDAYNANPSSMKVAVENFANMQVDNKIVVLGAMAELGTDSVDEHRRLVELLKQHKWKEVVLVGGDFEKVEHPYRAFRDAQEARNWLKSQQLENANVLVKGSRSAAMEKILE